MLRNWIDTSDWNELLDVRYREEREDMQFGWRVVILLAIVSLLCIVLFWAFMSYESEARRNGAQWRYYGTERWNAGTPYGGLMICVSVVVGGFAVLAFPFFLHSACVSAFRIKSGNREATLNQADPKSEEEFLEWKELVRTDSLMADFLHLEKEKQLSAWAQALDMKQLRRLLCRATSFQGLAEGRFRTSRKWFWIMALPVLERNSQLVFDGTKLSGPVPDDLASDMRRLQDAAGETRQLRLAAFGFLTILSALLLLLWLSSGFLQGFAACVILVFFPMSFLLGVEIMGAPSAVRTDPDWRRAAHLARTSYVIGLVIAVIEVVALLGLRAR